MADPATTADIARIDAKMEGMQVTLAKLETAMEKIADQGAQLLVMQSQIDRSNADLNRVGDIAREAHTKASKLWWALGLVLGIVYPVAGALVAWGLSH